MERKKVIIDTDPGVDDAMAIMMVLKHAETIDVLALTICHGNTNVEQAAKNAVEILKAAERLDIPVFIGSSKPLIKGPNEKECYFHGVDGLGDVSHQTELDFDKYLKKDENAIEALVRIVNSNKGEITLLCLGPLTNIALATCVDFEFSKKLKDCIAMGGNYKGQGNATPSAEFNFYKDPEAAQIVLTRLGCPITLITLELCYSTKVTWALYDDITNKGTRFSEFLRSIGVVMRNNSVPGFDTFAYDQIAAAVLIDEKVITQLVEITCQVELSGSNTRGQAVIDWRKSSIGDENNVRLVKEIDAEMFQKMLEKTVSN